MIASEAVPFSKTGGLGDVAGSLPLALGQLGHRVTLVVPRYHGVGAPGAPMDQFAVVLGGRPIEAGFFEQSLSSQVRAVLIDCPELYDREGIYGIGGEDYPDNPRRFAFLARGALELAVRLQVRFEVVHAHDWQAGLVPVYLKTRYSSQPPLGGLPSVFTIHNVAYQGLFAPEWLPALDLGADLFAPEALEFWRRISFLKGGINFSEQITTVSKKYASEILTREFGSGFEGILQRRKADLVGIVNGIDQSRWDPEADPFIPEHYSAERLKGKAVAKQELLRAFGLPTDETTLARPLVGMISRLVEQKGLDLVAEIADELPRLEASFVLLGSGNPRYEALLKELALAHPTKIGTRIGFDERLAHLIEAGADIFLMPSRFEPCGLSQLYSLRYGTVPIVRATGGLDDTVRNYSERSKRGTGFKFKEPTGQALLSALNRALRVYARRKDWKALQLAGMREDHSWDGPAREYVKVYRRAISRAIPARAPVLARP